jgi:hypothetical protein
MSYSQFWQDIFIYNFFEKKPGFYVELGCYDGSTTHVSNSLLLEENGWDGIGVDIDKIDIFNSFRKGKGVRADLTKISVQEILKENNAPETIDYLSYDVDQALKISLEKIDLSSFKFKIIHFEHNEYSHEYSGLKSQAYEKFTNAGYIRFIDNLIGENSIAVEDWYFHPEHVDINNIIFLSNIYYKDIIKKYNYL